uniref:BTB domain and CNC-like protein 2 n=1 Tax=Molossus molossus TaxID=27622 RepID=A0A7J8GP58_MOLMO|nr:BTB domain and CNC-like protein 2 [Molossus molossus]
MTWWSACLRRSRPGASGHCYSLPTPPSCYSAEKTSARSSAVPSSCACTTWRTPASASCRPSS